MFSSNVVKSTFCRVINNKYLMSIDSVLNCRKFVLFTQLSNTAAVAQTKPSKMPESLGRDYFILPNDTPFCKILCEEAFGLLTEKERLYAHYLSRASWYGSLICLLQTSPEAPLIFILVNKIFKNDSVENLKNIALKQCNFTEDEFKAFLIYACGLYSNMGNYKGFGDTKIIPNLDGAKFQKLLRCSTAYKKEKPRLDELWSLVGDKMFSLTEREKRLGLGKAGITTYLSANVEKPDADLIDRYFKSKRLEAWNTRLFKSCQNGKNAYEIRLASVESGEVYKAEDFEGSSVKVTRGDYSPLLQRVVHFLGKAKSFASNDNQTQMIDRYVDHFKTGSLNSHKEGSRFWIKDKGPSIESYIGFIENYRDPAGTRSEFEGFVAMVNKAMTKKFARLVEKAEEILPRLPWGKEYEKDKFLKPDFTSLDVLCFGGSGVPAGINIPNYDDIRQNEGFKNVSLGNVIAAIPNVKINFLTDDDQATMKKYHVASTEVQVGLHELLGHGSGKLFIKNKDGGFNFDAKSVKDLETGGNISTWYEEGETWSSKFGALASAYEECRAEAVGYFLSCFPDVLQIFGHEKSVADDVKYANWLSEIRSGLVGTEFYSTETKTWGQAHCHARFVLLRVVAEAGEKFVSINEFENQTDGKPDLLFKLDRTKIDSVGKPAVYEFLKKLQMHKATGNFEKGKKLFDHYSVMTPEVLRWRDIVIARRKPRRILVQPNTAVENEKVTLKTYPESPEGVIASYLERFEEDEIEKELYALWQKDKSYF